jgi:hypothetical protein
VDVCQHAGGGKAEQAGANVNRPPLYKHPRKGTNTQSGQFDEALVRWKKDLINFKVKSFKQKKLKQNINDF